MRSQEDTTYTQLDNAYGVKVYQVRNKVAGPTAAHQSKRLHEKAKEGMIDYLLKGGTAEQLKTVMEKVIQNWGK